MKKKYTPHNYIEVSLYKGHLVLDSQNTNYSYGNLHKVFQYAFKKIPFDKNIVKEVLILGFGAGSVASILKKELKCNCNITGVEIDNEIIKLAKKHFGLDEIKGIKVYNDDAFNYLEKCNKKFDMIVIDIFADHKIPSLFNSEVFLNKVYEILNNKGRVYYNRLCYDFESKRAGREFEIKFTSVFKNSVIIKRGIFSKNKIYHGTK